MASTTIKTFSSKGSAVGSFGGIGAGTPGFRQSNGQVYREPRRERFDQIGAGGAVRVTNPSAAPRRQARRSRGIGMGANNSSFQRLSN